MALLKLVDVSKHFGGLIAVNNVSLEVNQGELLGLIGPNGAGKTTLFNLISGFSKPTSGEIIYTGRNIAGLSPDRIAKIGIVRTFQQNALFGDFTVLENVYIGCQLKSKVHFLGALLYSSSYRKEEHNLIRESMQMLDLLGLTTLKDELAQNLPHGLQRILGMAIALAAEPKILLLDEPVTGMNPGEISNMMGIIRRVRELGTTIVIVEHTLRTIMELCEKIVVLDYGEKIAEGSPTEVRNDEQVVKAYFGMDNAEGNT